MNEPPPTGERLSRSGVPIIVAALAAAAVAAGLWVAGVFDDEPADDVDEASGDPSAEVPELPDDGAEVPELPDDGAEVAEIGTADVRVGDARFYVTVPIRTSPGAVIPFEICVTDPERTNTLPAFGWFLTVGRDPDGPDASHAEGTTDEAGCSDGELEIRETAPGSTDVRVSDGVETQWITSIAIEAGQPSDG